MPAWHGCEGIEEPGQYSFTSRIESNDNKIRRQNYGMNESNSQTSRRNMMAACSKAITSVEHVTSSVIPYNKANAASSTATES